MGSHKQKKEEVKRLQLKVGPGRLLDSKFRINHYIILFVCLFYFLPMVVFIYLSNFPSRTPTPPFPDSVEPFACWAIICQQLEIIYFQQPKLEEWICSEIKAIKTHIQAVQYYWHEPFQTLFQQQNKIQNTPFSKVILWIALVIKGWTVSFWRLCKKWVFVAAHLDLIRVPNQPKKI